MSSDIGGDNSIKKILILAANPKGTSRLRLDEEVREIEAGLKRAQKREQFDLKQYWAVRPRDVQQAMLDIDPQIVHFSGHGAGDEGLVFEDEVGRTKLISGKALAGLFRLFNQRVECVVLNGCYSEVQAEAIAQYIPSVIGMSQAIGDRAAVEFAVGFYNALGAGRSVEFAYELGCNAIQIAGIAEHLVPNLYIEGDLVPSSGKKEIATHQANPHPDLTTSEPASQAKTSKIIWRIEFDIAEPDMSKLPEILKTLQQLSGDPSLTLKRVKHSDR